MFEFLVALIHNLIFSNCKKNLLTAISEPDLRFHKISQDFLRFPSIFKRLKELGRLESRTSLCKSYKVTVYMQAY